MYYAIYYYTFIIAKYIHDYYSLLSNLNYPFYHFKGTGPNITRNAIVNCTELVTYDLIKDALIKSSLMTGKMRLQKSIANLS